MVSNASENLYNSCAFTTDNRHICNTSIKFTATFPDTTAWLGQHQQTDVGPMLQSGLTEYQQNRKNIFKDINEKDVMKSILDFIFGFQMTELRDVMNFNLHEDYKEDVEHKFWWKESIKKASWFRLKRAAFKLDLEELK